MPFRQSDCDILDYSQILTVNDLKTNALVQQVYPWFLDISWPDKTSFILNIVDQNLLLPESIKDSKLLVMSYHTEPYHYLNLTDIISQFPDTKIVILHDQVDNEYAIGYEHIRLLYYYSWHYQVQNAIDTSGYNTNPTARLSSNIKKFSSLCNRPTYTKLKVSSFLHEHYNEDSIVTIRSAELLEPVDFPVEVVTIDNPELLSAATGNFNWNLPLILNAAVNVTNETTSGGSMFYLTEKTWRPILAGVPIVHNGNSNFYSRLTSLGFKFHYNGILNKNYDKYKNHVLNAEYLCNETLTELAKYSTSDLIDATRNDSLHNLQHLVDPNGFTATCNAANQTTINEFIQFVEAV